MLDKHQPDMISSNDDVEDMIQEVQNDSQNQDDDSGVAPAAEPHEEARKAKVKKVMMKPSQQEVDEHMPTHIQFRSWCEHCVAGKAKSNPHAKQKNKE